MGGRIWECVCEVDPRDTDPISLPLKTQACVGSAALTAGDCLAGQSLPPLPVFSIPKIPTRIRLLTLQTTPNVNWRSREPVVPRGDVRKAPRVPALERARHGLCFCRARRVPAGIALGLRRPPPARWERLHSSRIPAGSRCKAAWTHASPWQQKTGPDPAAAQGRDGSSRRWLASGPRQRVRHVPQGGSPHGLACHHRAAPLRSVVRAARCLPRCGEGCGESCTRQREARCPWGTGDLPAGGQAHGRPLCCLRAGK